MRSTAICRKRRSTGWSGRPRGGQTLQEVLLSMTLLSILSVGTSMLYVQSVRMYKRGTLEATSRDRACLALEYMLPEIRAAYNVDYPGPSSIVLTTVARNADGSYQMDPTSKQIVSGKEVIFYLSDAQGSIVTFELPPPPVDPEEEDPDPPDPDADPEYGYCGASGGHYVWRAERASDGVPWTSFKLLAGNVEDMAFAYAPSEDALELVQIAVTIGQGEAPGYYNRTEIASVRVSNH